MIKREEKQKYYFNKKASGNLSAFGADNPVTMKLGDTWKRAEATPQSTPRPYGVREERRTV